MGRRPAECRRIQGRFYLVPHLTEGAGALKQVLAALDKGPNYIFHLAALASAGFRSDYVDTYARTVAPEDLQALRKHGGRLDFGFGSGHGGDLASLLIFHPAYLDLDSVNAFAEFFTLLDEGFRAGDFSRFLQRYSREHAELRNWVFHVDQRWLSSVQASRDVIRELGGAYVRSLPAYESEVWPVESPKMADVASGLNAYFRERDVIGKWEEVTGLTFKYPVYRIILCSALKDGPQANSLGYEKNTFYYGSDFGWLTDFVSHEVGTHILIGLAKEMMATGPFDYLAYRAHENLARFYNFRVLGKDKLYGMSPQYHCEEFLSVYAAISARESGITPSGMFREGLDLFRTRYPELM